jgi:FkbM family methyltransferase
MYTPTPSCQIKNLTDIYMETFGYIEDGFFVDVGAFDGEQWSNTLTLSHAGWKGLAIEPNPEYYAKLKKLCEEEFPKVKPHWEAVANEQTSASLFTGGSLSTIKPKRVEVYNDIDWSQSSGLSLNKYVRVPVTKLDIILGGYLVQPKFEVLSIDVEGAEIDVLKGFSIDFYQPQLVIVETHEQNEDKRLARKARWINCYMKKYGYKNIQSDTINSIYRRQDG